MAEEKVIDKIRKLLALANNAGATDGEISNAMKMAHSLLAKHNLDMKDIGEKDPMSEDNIIFMNRPWVRRTVSAICNLYFCGYMVHMYDKRTKTRHTIIGRESNVVTAKIIAEYVVRTIKKQSRRIKRNSGGSSIAGRSFCEGASHRIVQRVYVLMEDSKKETRGVGKNKELMISNLYLEAEEENEGFMGQQHGETSKVKSLSRKDQDARAFAQGSDYGNKISLNTQIQGTKTGRFIGKSNTPKEIDR